MALITLSDIKLPLDKGEDSLLKLAEKKLGGKAGYFKIKKKSLKNGGGLQNPFFCV